MTHWFDHNTLRARLRGVDWKQTAFDYLMITLGVFLLSLAFNLFYVPNEVVPGGVFSVGVLANSALGIPVGVVTMVLNIPIFLAGLRWAGGVSSGLRTVYAILLFSVLVDALAGKLPEVTREPLLYIAYGGTLDGLGIGLVLRAEGTTGGTDILGRLLNRFTGIRTSQGIFLFNGLILAGAAWLFGVEQAMYGVMLAGVSAFVADLVLAGGRQARQAFIISSKWEAIRDRLLHSLGRGVTILSGEGAYTGSERPTLMCIIGRSEVIPLKRLVSEVDPQAFVVIGTTSDVWGEGFERMDGQSPT